jgi:D-alanine-D-alanine ligase
VKKIRVGVVFGGQSGEHEVSLVSAQSVMRSLDPARYEVVPIGITRGGAWIGGADPMAALQDSARQAGRLLTPGQTAENAADPVPADHQALKVVDARTSATALQRLTRGVDVVFPVLHGPFGEDGTIQGLLEMAGVPYVGAGVLGSALGMDKIAQKTLLRASGIPVVNWVASTRREWAADPEGILNRVEAELGYPCFSKPANLGSSVGICKARDRDELRRGMEEAAGHDRRILVEQAAPDCREIECSVLGNDEPVASVPGEIRPHREFYDYTAKYVSSDTDLIIPAVLTPDQTNLIRELAVRAFLAIDCAGMARADFFVGRSADYVYVNELNTIPGFTAISMYPKLWQASGLSYPQLLDRLISLAMERHSRDSRQV